MTTTHQENAKVTTDLVTEVKIIRSLARDSSGKI